MSATLATSPAFRITGLTKVMDLTGYVRDGGWHTYEARKDGKFLMLRNDLTPGPLVMVTNWVKELKP
jgi:hypothetical protein